MLCVFKLCDGQRKCKEAKKAPDGLTSSTCTSHIHRQPNGHITAHKYMYGGRYIGVDGVRNPSIC